MAKIYIIDGNSLLFRAYYATYTEDKNRLMTDKNGTPTNAIFAFSNMIASIIHSLNKGDGIFVAFDKGAHTLRHKKLESYKANRKPCPPELLLQMPIAREFLDSLNIVYYEDDDYEADDIAGNMAKKASEEGYKVYLYTSDKDYLQLIDDNISVKLIKRGLKDIEEMNIITFKEKWGFDPSRIIDYKGLMGDPSDNLKGIPKIGDKTAKSLIIKYGNFENIFLHVNELSPSIQKSLTENIEQGRISKEMAIIDASFKMPYQPHDIVYNGYDFALINNFSNKYGFRTFVNKLPNSLRIRNKKIEKISYEEIVDIDSLDIPMEFGIGIDIEEGNYHNVNLYGISISFNDKNYYISLENIAKSHDFKEILKNDNYKKYCFNFKRIKCVLSRYNIEISGLKFDLLLATYLIEPSIKSDLNSIMSFLGYDINYAFDTLDLFTTANPILCSVSSFYPLVLFETLNHKLGELNQLELLYEIEQPLTIILADMEIEGFPLDKKTITDLGIQYKEKITTLTSEIYKLADKEFNINSPKELAEILYDKLGLKGNKRMSTSVEYLKELINDHPIVSKILEYRKYSKLLSTYVVGFLSSIHEDGKIHATFNQALTQTGRLSSSEPNLQNISIRDEDGKNIRKAFFYNEDNVSIISLDYSQIELRVLASLSDSPSLISVFNEEQDIHAETAKKVFHLLREPTELERRKAKAVNFGIIYGISDWGLADQLNISTKEAREIIVSFNNEFPEIKNYLEFLIKDATAKGYATTLFNRRRYIPELTSDNYQTREFAKRAAMNAPIQGSAADIIKIAMIKVTNELKKNNYKSVIVSQIHDELIIKAYDNEIDEVFKISKDIMEKAVKLSVNLKVDGGYAKTWFDAK